MKTPAYRERDFTFGQAMLALRKAIGLTQAGLADYLGVSRHAVSFWEAGSSYPKAENLKEIIALALKHHGFEKGREAEEIRALWKAAHQKVWLSEEWLSALLAQTTPSPTMQVNNHTQRRVLPVPDRSGPNLDWGEALAVPTFYGREWELKLLREWVVDERCQVVSLLGMGGIGKSALGVKLMHQVAEHFDVVIWRSLRDTPACEQLLDDFLRVLTPLSFGEEPVNIERRFSLLLEQLRARRVLLVLDNLETLLLDVEGTSNLRPGFESYGRLLQGIAGTAHQSCVILTSREKPAILVSFEGNRSPVRVLRLSQLDILSCNLLLTEKLVKGTKAELARLIEVYTGNPLVLKIVARTIVDLFGGELTSFLEQGEMIFGGVRELLDGQFNRLSELEQTVLLWFAIMREPSNIDDLRRVLVRPVPTVRLLEAVEGLHRRSLIERGQKPGTFTLQSVVLEYASTRLIQETGKEILQGQLDRLINHSLSLVGSREYIRQTQERLLMAPVLAYIRDFYQLQVKMEAQLLSLITSLKNHPMDAHGYGPANLITFLRMLRGNLRHLDLSGLALRGLYLQGVEMQDTTLAGGIIRDCIFTEDFDVTWAVAISPDGQYWAAGGRRGEVRLWSNEGEHLHLAWQAHTDTIRSLAFSPDANTLATGSWDGTIKLWDLESGALIWKNEATDNIEVLTFAPDGRVLASGGDDAAIRLWDTKSGTLRKTIPSQSGPILALAWSPDATKLASGGTNGTIRMWDFSANPSEATIHLFTGHTNWVLGLAFSPDGTMLASASWDCTVRLWDVATGNLNQTLTGHRDRVRAVAWSQDGNLLASCGFDQTVWLWDKTWDSYRTGLHGHTAGVYAVTFTPDSHKLVSGSEDGTMRVWDLESAHCISIKQGYSISLYDITWGPDGANLASGGSNGIVTIWDVHGQMAPQQLYGHRSLVEGVSWSPDGRVLASCGLDNAIRLWDPITGEIRQILQDPEQLNALFYGVAWSPDGTQLASASYQQGVQVWEVATGRCRWSGRAQPTRIRCVAWSPDGAWLASCGDNGSICLWEATDGTLRTSMEGHRGMVMDIAWSPDGRRLASGGGRGSGELFVWDVQSGERVQTWTELNTIVNGLAWSPTGEVLLSGESDGNLRWWDVQQGKCLTVRKGHKGAIQSLRESPEGLRVASCGDDNIIQVWDVHNGEHLQTLKGERPYDRLDLSGLQGVSEAQKVALLALGAIEQ